VEARRGRALRGGFGASGTQAAGAGAGGRELEIRNKLEFLIKAYQKPISSPSTSPSPNPY